MENQSTLPFLLPEEDGPMYGLLPEGTLLSEGVFGMLNLTEIGVDVSELVPSISKDPEPTATGVGSLFDQDWISSNTGYDDVHPFYPEMTGVNEEVMNTGSTIGDGDAPYQDLDSASLSSYFDLADRDPESASGSDELPEDDANDLADRAPESASGSDTLPDDDPNRAMLMCLLEEEPCRREDQVMSSDEEDVEAVLEATRVQSPISSLGDSEEESSWSESELSSRNRSSICSSSSIADSFKMTTVKIKEQSDRSDDDDDSTDSSVVMMNNKSEESADISTPASVVMSHFLTDSSSDGSSDSSSNNSSDSSSDGSSDDNGVKDEDVSRERSLHMVVPPSTTGSTIKLPPSAYEQMVYITRGPTGWKSTRRAGKRRAEAGATPGPSTPKKAPKKPAKRPAKRPAKKPAKRPARKRSRKGEYPCTYCGEVFTQGSNLSRHKKQRHLNTPDITCGNCGYILKRGDYLAGHQKSQRCERAAAERKRQSLDITVFE